MIKCAAPVESLLIGSQGLSEKGTESKCLGRWRRRSEERKDEKKESEGEISNIDPILSDCNRAQSYWLGEAKLLTRESLGVL